METKDLKKLFSAIAIKNGFTNEFNAYFKESNDCVIALILRKSSFSRLYYLRIKVELKPLGDIFQGKKEWVKHDVADILLGIEGEFIEIFDLENELSDEDRISRLDELFVSYLSVLIGKALKKSGLIELSNSGKIFLMPHAKSKLGI